jgi:hypothetical protein
MIEMEQILKESEQRLKETEQRSKELESRKPVDGISILIFTNTPYFIQNLNNGTWYLDTDRIGGLTFGSHV